MVFAMILPSGSASTYRSRISFRLHLSQTSFTTCSLVPHLLGAMVVVLSGEMSTHCRCHIKSPAAFHLSFRRDVQEHYSLRGIDMRHISHRREVKLQGLMGDNALEGSLAWTLRRNFRMSTSPPDLAPRTIGDHG